MKKTLLTYLIQFYCVLVFSNTLNVPSQFTAIQSALNVAVSSDTILVQPGTYFENIVWPNVNGIKLLSAGDSSNTIIDGNFAARVI